MSQNSKLLQVFEGTENSNKGPVFLTMSKKKKKSKANRSSTTFPLNF